MKVSATPIPVERANSRSAEAASARDTPLPARTIGLLAWRDDLGGLQELAGARLQAPLADAAVRAAARRRPGAPMTSSGSSMCVGPGLGSCATLNALRTTSGITSGAFSRVFHFVTGFITETMSMYWCDSLCMRWRSPWPVRATSGERSRKASAMPVTRFVAPGPSVPRQTPALPVRRPYMSAM